MSTKRGFTLIELLVVIAIITILASIVAPKIYNAMERAKMARAYSEIKNADLALTKMLTDAERKHFGHFFQNFDPTIFNDNTGVNYAAAVQAYTTVFYELLRRGKSADVVGVLGPDADLKAEIRRKLGTSYMDIGKDPWSNLYQFYAGPFSRQVIIYPFRAFRVDENFVYTDITRTELQTEMRGNPPADYAAGFPCPGDLPVYIYSWGGDGVPNQNLDLLLGVQQGGPVEENLTRDGYDDINNWDTQSNWGEFY